MKPLRDATEAEVQAALLEVISRHKDEIRAAAPYLQALNVGHEQYQRIYSAVANAETFSDILAACNTPAELSLARSVMEHVKNSRAQSNRASGERQDETLRDAIKSMAFWHDEIGRKYTAKQLWPELFAALDIGGASPEEVEDKDDVRKCRIDYVRANGKPDKITFGAFQNALTKARKD